MHFSQEAANRQNRTATTGINSLVFIIFGLELVTSVSRLTLQNVTNFSQKSTSGNMLGATVNIVGETIESHPTFHPIETVFRRYVTVNSRFWELSHGIIRTLISKPNRIMKKNILLFVLTLAVSLGAIAQNKVEVKEATANFSTGKQIALTVIVLEGDLKEVEKAWKKEMKGMKAKVSSKKEIFADDATMKSMGDNAFDVYAVFEEIENVGVKVYAAFDLGGAYLSKSSHPDRYKVAKEFMYNFGVDQTKAKIGGDIKVAEKELSSREKDLKDLEKEKSNLEKTIEDAQKAIEKAKKDLVDNANSQDKKGQEIEAQKAVVESLEKKQKAVR